MSSTRLALRRDRTASHKIHRLRDRIENDLRLTAFQLSHDVRDFLLQRKLPLAVFGTLAQHKGFHDAA